MQEQLKILYELQKVDDDLLELKLEAAVIPKKMEEITRQIEEQKSIVERKEAGLKNLTKSRRNKEIELESLEDKMKNDRIKLMEVKTNKEYHSVQKEITNRQESMGVLEEEILLLMDEIEQYEVETKRITARLNGHKKELGEDIAKLEAQANTIPKSLAERKTVRDELSANVNEDLLKRYSLTKNQRQGQAVAFVENGICMGCQLEIPPQQFNLIQKNENVYTCPNCYRILYFPGKAKINELE